MTSKDADPPKTIADLDLDDFRGGAWSILGGIPKQPDHGADGDPDGAAEDRPQEVTRSKLLHK